MHTFQQIIENQEKYKDNILRFFVDEINVVTQKLISIDTEDKFIMEEREKLLNKFRKTNTFDTIKKYFFRSNKRDEKFYVWWDDIQQEALILPYGKK